MINDKWKKNFFSDFCDLRLRFLRFVKCRSVEILRKLLKSLELLENELY